MVTFDLKFSLTRVTSRHCQEREPQQQSPKKAFQWLPTKDQRQRRPQTQDPDRRVLRRSRHDER